MYACFVPFDFILYVMHDVNLFLTANKFGIQAVIT